MSLRHLYKDLSNLGVYPDLIKPHFHPFLFTSDGVCHSKYYGIKVEYSWVNGEALITFYDMFGNIHNSNGPAQFVSPWNYYDIVSSIVNEILDGDEVIGLYNLKWFNHGVQLSKTISTSTLDKIINDGIVPKIKTWDDCVLFDGCAFEVDESFESDGYHIYFERGYMIISKDDKQVWMSYYDGEISYRKYGNVEIYHKDGKGYIIT